MPRSVRQGDGELAVLVLLMAVVVLALTFYWRTPDSAGGPQVCAGPPCVVVVWPWAD